MIAERDEALGQRRRLQQEVREAVEKNERLAAAREDLSRNAQVSGSKPLVPMPGALSLLTKGLEERTERVSETGSIRSKRKPAGEK